MKLSKETAHLYTDKLYKEHLQLKKMKQQLSQLQQLNNQIQDSINESNLAKISALLKVENLQEENQKLKSHIEMQDLTIQKLYSQLEQPITTISGTTPVQTKDYTTNYKYKLTSVCTGCERLKQEKKELIKWLAEKLKNVNWYKVDNFDRGYATAMQEIRDKLKEGDKNEYRRD